MSSRYNIFIQIILNSLNLCMHTIGSFGKEIVILMIVGYFSFSINVANCLEEEDIQSYEDDKAATEIGIPQYEIHLESLKNDLFEFKHLSIPVHRRQLFDIGVTDINQDGLLDIFTSNCNFRPSYLINQGGFKFQNATTQLKLDLQPELPDFACSLILPRFNSGGLYIYYIWGKIYLNYVRFLQEENIRVNVKVPHHMVDVSNLLEERIRITFFENSTEVQINFPTEEPVEIDVKFPSIPIEFEIDRKLPLSNIFIGFGKANPQKHLFSLSTIDLHSYAWADIDRDGYLDLFRGRGGLRGTKEFGYITQNLLHNYIYLNTRNSSYKNLPSFEQRYEIHTSGECRCGTRKACWVDIDNDGALELFVICAREESAQLLKKSRDGYKECSHEYGINIKGEFPYFWYDFNDDSFIDLLTFNGSKFVVYENITGGKFREHNIYTLKESIDPLLIIANDIDFDGCLEFLTVDSGTFRVYGFKHIFEFNFDEFQFTELGLPEFSYWCAWADLDNDSIDEFISIPDGIYRWNTKFLKYEKTNLLQLSNLTPEKFSDARVLVFDGDNDGNLDLLIGYRERSVNVKTGYGKWWYLSAFRNITHSGNWVQVDCTYPRTSTFIGFGDKVLLKTKQGKEILRVIGQFENSKAHQGHYRIYFGLGEDYPEELIIPKLRRLSKKSSFKVIDVNKVYSFDELQ